MNSGLYPMAWKERDWLFEWKEPMLLASDYAIFKRGPLLMAIDSHYRWYSEAAQTFTVFHND